ncbi:hypothetical protein LEP3755_25750 [Leptolyngbya sp. NIES-3755]|nr:hypothetical protein LEP3755_25750 [Leptolyngbya sp. NIES-3755]
MAYPKLSGEEITQQGRAIYNNLRSKVETQENIGKLISIDVETGDYAIGDDLIVLSRHLQAKHSNAPIWAGRIGFNAVYAIGGTLIRTD